MDIQTPSGKTVEQVIWNLKKHAQESEERELSWAQQQMSSIQKYIYHILNKPKRPITDELMPVQPITPAAFRVPEDELQQLQKSLARKNTMRTDGPPTTLLGTHDVSMDATIIMPIEHTEKAVKPVRLIAPEDKITPQQTTYKITDITIAIASAIQNHIDRCGRAPDRIAMNQWNKHLIGVLNMENYILPQKVVEFVVDEAIDDTTLLCISY